jgi:hypothetical protein
MGQVKVSEMREDEASYKLKRRKRLKRALLERWESVSKLCLRVGEG